MRDKRGSPAAKGARRKGGSSGRSSGDRTSARLNKLAKAIGNDEIAKRLQQGSATRDQMLAHMCERLKIMQQFQKREAQATQRGANFAWWRDVSDRNKTTFTEPDAKRWHLPARLYERAAEHLCRGELHRGKQIMEQAMAEEQRVIDETSEVVDTLDAEEDADAGTGFLDDIVENQATGPCDMPEDLRIAQEILAVPDGVPTIPNRPALRPWWAEEEEEEEEEDEDGSEG